MKTTIKALLKPQWLAFGFALVLVPLLFIITQHASRQLVESRIWVEHTYSVLFRVEELRSDMETLETARRGFFITRQAQYLQPFHLSRQRVFDNLEALEGLMKDNAIQRRRLDTVRPIIQSLVDLANQDFAASETDRKPEVMARAKALIDHGRQLIEEMRNDEKRLLVKRTADLDIRQHELNLVMLGMASSLILCLLFSFFTIFRENIRRRRIEEGLRESQAINEAAVRNLSLMHELTSLLQACTNISESLDVIQQFSSRLLNVSSGALYLFRESRNLLERTIIWGEPNGRTSFQPEDCWALRRGEPHMLDHQHHSLACDHVGEASDTISLCMPVTAKGNVLGILYLQNQPSKNISEIEHRLAATLASQIALALSNIKLRDTLRDLSVRDPLTGLFNRRYMEESLQREIATAKRKQRQFGLAILDIDHFKKFNDTFGHDAGDLLLREVGELLMQRSRAGDIACRFGGEEFVMIYPEAASAIVTKLADDLRQAIHHMQVHHYGRALGQVSASFGLSFFPEHGDTTDALLRAADKALYAAKAAGRNCVQAAEPPQMQNNRPDI